MTNWEKLCELITNDKTFGKAKRRYGGDGKGEKERRFEDHFAEYLFTVFDWASSEIKRQASLPVGSNNRAILDIMLVKDEEQPFIFELKNYTVFPDSAGYAEIQSQIKLANTNFGIFTNGITLHLLYRTSFDKDPEEIFCVSYLDRTNEEAIELCNLLDGKSYSTKNLVAFCEKLKKAIKTEYENNPRLFMISSQMNKERDEKIQRMIAKYIKWINDNPKEYEAAFSFKKERKWIRNNIFDTEKLRTLPDDEYSQLMHEIPKHTLAINGYAMMMLYGEKNGKPLPEMGIIGDRKKFIKCIEYLNSIPRKDAREALKNFTTNGSEYKILGVGKMFWSEMIRCKFDNIPLQNNKTNKFFRAIGIELGFSPEQKSQSIVYCYNRWLSEWNKDKNHLQLDSSVLSHMEHFALASEEGEKYLSQEFGYTPEGESGDQSKSWIPKNP